MFQLRCPPWARPCWHSRALNIRPSPASALRGTAGPDDVLECLEWLESWASLQGSEPLQISKYISDLCYMLDI